MPKIPRSIIVMYILMIIVLLGLCTGVFIVLFSNVTDDSQKSSSTSYPLIESSSSVSSSVSSSTSSSITESSSSTDVVFTSTESTESAPNTAIMTIRDAFRLLAVPSDAAFTAAADPRTTFSFMPFL